MNEDSATDENEGQTTELLLEAVKRAPLLAELLDGPTEMRQLNRRLAPSRSTIHRTVQTFTDRGIVDKTDDGLRLTGFGRAIAHFTVEYQERLESATRLEPFLNTISPADVDIPVEFFADATVARPKPSHPHFAIKRIAELIEASDSLRMFSSVISPFYVDVTHREMMNGMEIEVIFDETLAETILSEYHDEAVESLESGRFEVYLHDHVPFELFIFEDRMGMAAHDDRGIARALVETDAPEAITWAEDVYESYAAESDTISF
jgi:predicted transcriptional regulator